MNLPCRVTSSISSPRRAESGGSYVFSALNAASSTSAMVCPTHALAQEPRERLDLGHLRHGDHYPRGASSRAQAASGPPRSRPR